MTTYSYQWLRGDALTPITGANAQAYPPTDQDVGFRLRVSVKAINLAGASLEAISLPTAIVIAAATANTAPIWTSPNTCSVSENTATPFYTCSAVDPENQALTFAIVGGADANKFTLQGGTGLKFVTAPNYEAPTDADGDNVYSLTLSVTDGANTVNQLLSVTVVNVLETALPGLTVVPVSGLSGNLPAGTVVANITAGHVAGDVTTLSASAVTAGFTLNAAKTQILVGVNGWGPGSFTGSLTQTHPDSATSPATTFTVSSGTLAMTVTGSLTFVSIDTPAGTVIGNINNVPPGITPTVSPADGRVVVAGSQGTGWKLAVGNTAAAAGSIALSVLATGQPAVNVTVTITASAAVEPAFTVGNSLGNIVVNNTVANNAAIASGFQLFDRIPSKTGMAVDFSNVRLGYLNGGVMTEIPFFIDPVNTVGGTLALWYKLPAVAAGATVTVYYDAGALTPRSNGAATFPEFFEDGRTVGDTTKWAQTLGVTGSGISYQRSCVLTKRFSTPLQYMQSMCITPTGLVLTDRDANHNGRAFMYNPQTGAQILGPQATTAHPWLAMYVPEMDWVGFSSSGSAGAGAGDGKLRLARGTDLVEVAQIAVPEAVAAGQSANLIYMKANTCLRLVSGGFDEYQMDWNGLTATKSRQWRLPTGDILPEVGQGVVYRAKYPDGTTDHAIYAIGNSSDGSNVYLLRYAMNTPAAGVDGTLTFAGRWRQISRTVDGTINEPEGITVDQAGNMLLADLNSTTLAVRVFDAAFPAAPVSHAYLANEGFAIEGGVFLSSPDVTTGAAAQMVSKVALTGPSKSITFLRGAPKQAALTAGNYSAFGFCNAAITNAVWFRRGTPSTNPDGTVLLERRVAPSTVTSPSVTVNTMTGNSLNTIVREGVWIAEYDGVRSKYQYNDTVLATYTTTLPATANLNDYLYASSGNAITGGVAMLVNAYARARALPNTQPEPTRVVT